LPLHFNGLKHSLNQINALQHHVMPDWDISAVFGII